MDKIEALALLLCSLAICFLGYHFNEAKNNFKDETRAMQSQITDLTGEIYKLTNTNNDLKKKMDSLLSDKESSIAFFATIKSHPFKLHGIDDIVKFDNVKLNRGDGYDPFSGLFIAPRPGIYQFSTMILGNHGSHVHYQLNKNTDVYVLGFSKTGTADSSTISVIVDMKKGDKVFVKHRLQGEEQIFGADHSSFSGYFIME